MKNIHSFFSWQGNLLSWPSYSKWIALGLTVLFLVLIWVFKKQIRSFFAKGKESSWDKRLQWFGVALLLLQITKLILYIVGDYPIHWEYMWLHICRIHMILITVFLIIKKKELIKYITYISLMGALFAMYFGDQSWNAVAGTNKETIFVQEGIKFYSVGPDNFFWWDFFAFHIAIIVIPIILWVGFDWKVKTVNLYRMAIVYGLGIIFIWALNIAMDQINDERWWANNWYIGMDKANDYNRALGILSGWPQNLFVYLLIGAITIHIFHLIWILQSSHRKELFDSFVKGYKGLSKNFFKFKRA